MLAGIGASIAFWSRLAKRDDRLLIIYIAALAGAFLGAKIVYIAAEGWLHFGAPDLWLQLVTGKSILGGANLWATSLTRKPSTVTSASLKPVFPAM